MNRRSFLTLIGSAVAALAFRLPSGPPPAWNDSLRLTLSEVVAANDFLRVWAQDATPPYLVVGPHSVIQEVVDWYRDDAAV
jgi:hypothetical protein